MHWNATVDGTNGIYNRLKKAIFRTWLVRVYGKHGWEHLTDLAFGGLMSETQKKTKNLLLAWEGTVFGLSRTQSKWRAHYLPIS